MSVEWTEERIEELSKLWAEGLSAAEIGKRLGITKNAVVGKVHRLGLPKRGSPIKRSATPKPRPKRKEVKGGGTVTLQSLKSGMCSWPTGEPGTPEFRFCGEETVSGKPYCATHCERAYVKSSKGEKQRTEAA